MTFAGVGIEKVKVRRKSSSVSQAGFAKSGQEKSSSGLLLSSSPAVLVCSSLTFERRRLACFSIKNVWKPLFL